MHSEEVESLLSQISETLEKILSRSENLSSANDYYLSPSIVFDVVKTKLRPMLDAITQMQKME